MTSLWMKTEEKILDNNVKLEDKEEADVCIIGGGITGISTAYYLSKAGKKVIVLERGKIAKKTTGNTTAKITAQHGLFYKYLIDNFSRDYAEKYYNANQEAIGNIEKAIKDENIKCDFERQNAYVFTRSKQEIQKIREEVEAVKEIGGEAEFIETIEPKIENVIRWYNVSKSGYV